MFKNAKVGDMVWNTKMGPGKIIDIENDAVFPIIARFFHKLNILEAYDNELSFTYEGKEFTYDLNPTLFWDEVKIIPPEQPKRMVKKTFEGWINISSADAADIIGGIYLYCSDIWSTKEVAIKNKVDSRMATAKVSGEYEVEE